MKLKVSKHPQAKRCSVSFDCDCPSQEAYDRMMRIIKEKGVVATVDDGFDGESRSFEGKTYADLDQMKADVREGFLDFGWYITKGHHWVGHESPTPCVVPSEEEIRRFEDQHERHVSTMVFPCGLRENEKDFENMFVARASNVTSHGETTYDYDMQNLLNLPVPSRWDPKPKVGGAPSASESLKRAKSDFEKALDEGGVFFNFVHWHWLSGFVDGVDSWREYEDLINHVSGHRDCHYTSVPRIFEYALLRESIEITELGPGNWRLELRSLPNHRIAFSKLNTPLTFVLETTSNSKLLVGGHECESFAAGEADRRYFEISPSRFPLDISIVSV